MRRLLVLSLIIMALVVTACGGGSTPEPTATPMPAAPAAQPTNTPAAAQPTATTAAVEPAATRPAPAGPTIELPEVNPLETTGDIIVAGSSTVFPLTERMAERFRDEGYAGNITIDSIGTGAGFERFCVAGETDISNASRPVKDSERESCRTIGREAIEFRVGTDALAVVVNPGNDWVGPEGVTLEELAKLFSSDVTNWSDVNPAWPAQPVKRFSPGTDSGTFDYFIEAVMDPAYPDAGEQALLSAANLQLSEDDNVLVQGVSGDQYAIGYFGFAYFEENAAKLRDLSIEGVAPTADTVNAGEYALARPLFIYSDAGVMAAKPQVADFINFYLTFVNDEVIDVGYFPASDEALGLARDNWLNATMQ
ncbi:MAG: PstS family phosphate ABC transporter substrate-binding protein [Anaerolineae bacterium]